MAFKQANSRQHNLMTLRIAGINPPVQPFALNDFGCIGREKLS